MSHRTPPIPVRPPTGGDTIRNLSSSRAVALLGKTRQSRQICDPIALSFCKVRRTTTSYTSGLQTSCIQQQHAQNPAGRRTPSLLREPPPPPRDKLNLFKNSLWVPVHALYSLQNRPPPPCFVCLLWTLGSARSTNRKGSSPLVIPASFTPAQGEQHSHD